MKKIAFTIAAVGMLLTAAPTAQAETHQLADNIGTITALGPVAPSCVHREVRDHSGTVGVDELYTWNQCNEDKWLKVIIAWGPDSPCRLLEDGHGRVIFFWPAPGQYDRLETC